MHDLGRTNRLARRAVAVIGLLSLVPACGGAVMATNGERFGPGGESLEDAALASARRDMACDAIDVRIDGASHPAIAYATGCGVTLTYALSPSGDDHSGDGRLELMGTMP